MNAQKICNKVLEEISEEDTIIGQIHSVFKRACNIITKNGEIISILSGEKSMAPMSILLNKEFDFIASGFTQGGKVISGKGNIIIKDLEYRINLKMAKIWDSTPVFSYTKDNSTEILRKLDKMEKCIFDIGNLEGIAPILIRFGGITEDFQTSNMMETPLNKYCQFIGDSLERFIYLVMTRDIERIPEASKHIIGFGPGLTPAVDDFICGLMTSLIYMAEYLGRDVSDIYELNRSIVGQIENRTTKISEEMLKLASVGKMTEDIGAFLISLLSPVKEKIFINNIKKVLEFGSTSGTDTLCGIYMGCRIMFNKNNRGCF